MFRKLFGKKEHQHEYTIEFVYHSSKIHLLSTNACTAKIHRCKCGEEFREITPAGAQQLRWGDDEREVLGYDKGKDTLC